MVLILSELSQAKIYPLSPCKTWQKKIHCAFISSISHLSPMGSNEPLPSLVSHGPHSFFWRGVCKSSHILVRVILKGKFNGNCRCLSLQGKKKITPSITHSQDSPSPIISSQSNLSFPILNPTTTGYMSLIV